VLSSIAGLATLVTNLNTLKEAFGFGSKRPEITLQVWQAQPAGNSYLVPVNFTKTGDSILHNCSFSAWIQGFQMDTDSPMKIFTIPEGVFTQSAGVFIKLPPFFAVVDDYGQISLNCDHASSPSVRFRNPGP
jgi:hypothetical protein